MSVIEDVDTSQDTWISQAEFSSANRRLENFKQVRLGWVDVDSYKVLELQHKTPEQLLSVLLKTCEERGLPGPSLVVFSGCGLQVKWLFDSPVHKPDLPLWNRLQRELCHRLRDIGGDPQACDGSRVLRLVGTINSKSGALVKVIHSPLYTYCFNALATSVLAGVEAVQGSDQRATEQGESAFQGVDDGADRSTTKEATGHLVSDASLVNLRPFLASRLALARLQDLDKLAKLRGYKDGAPDGMRNPFVFLGATFLTQAFVQPARLAHEIKALAAKFAPSWTRDKVRQCTSGIVERMRGFAAGERVEYQGRSFDKRYTFNNLTLLEWLEITPDEESKLTTIIGKTEKARRARVHAHDARREAGSVERVVYLAEVAGTAAQKHLSARLLRQQGSSWAQVAATVGYKNAATARVACSV